MGAKVGYGVHIVRASNDPIDINDWLVAVERSENVRLADVPPVHIKNAETGEQVSRSNTPGLAEVFDRKTQDWILAFRWFEGRISTNAARDFDDYESYQRSIMRSLAAGLNARIVGDEGETYD